MRSRFRSPDFDLGKTGDWRFPQPMAAGVPPCTVESAAGETHPMIQSYHILASPAGCLASNLCVYTYGWVPPAQIGRVMTSPSCRHLHLLYFCSCS